MIAVCSATSVAARSTVVAEPEVLLRATLPPRRFRCVSRHLPPLLLPLLLPHRSSCRFNHRTSSRCHPPSAVLRNSCLPRLEHGVGCLASAARFSEVGRPERKRVLSHSLLPGPSTVLRPGGMRPAIRHLNHPAETPCARPARAPGLRVLTIFVHSRDSDRFLISRRFLTDI